MYISHLTVKNFRAIADIDCDLSPHVNVIVGPNAVGKTTLLQAIRLAKALAAPRTQQEPMQVLISLSAASPHFPQRAFLKNLAREQGRPIEIRTTYFLSESEITILKNSSTEIIQNLVTSRLGQAFTNPAQLTQFLQSPFGQQQLKTATDEVSQALTRIQQEKTVTVGLAMSSGPEILHSDPLGGPFIAFLDRRLPPLLSLFSYFPADRALPMGEVNMQIGGPDSQQQVESHNSQPQLKYQRLKTLIVNSMVLGNGATSIKADFAKIFSGLLIERQIDNIQINELGLLSIMTKEVSTGNLIELDSLSSGEKNIALTFLLIARSIERGGIALFDEPELHLNPAVCRELLPFITKEYSIDRNIQFIMCTHSPEVLSGAFKRDDCTLLHLKSPNDLTKIGKSSISEYSDALQRLGTSISETLFYVGTIFVEGEDDIDFLTIGFPDQVRRFQIKDRGGRREIEKSIKSLQELELKGQKVAPVFLIFDKDDEPSGLQSSSAVQIRQWERRCADNYLIDIDVISELLKDSDVTRRPIDSAGEVHRICRELAFKQLNLLAARIAYDSYGYQNSSLTKDELKGESLEEIASNFFVRLSKARDSLDNQAREIWISKFLKDCEDRKSALQLTWEAKWKDLCDGKRLISDLHKASDLKMSEASFKELIVRKMRDSASENWRLVKALLEEFLKLPA